MEARDIKRSLFVRNLKRARHAAVLALLLVGALTIAACADPSSPTGLSSVPDSDPGPPRSIRSPSEDGVWVIPEVTWEGRLPSGSCGFVYEIGLDEFSGFNGSHIHIPLDVRMIVSPEHALWFWICLWVDIHKWVGLSLFAVVILHVSLYYRWLVQSTRLYLQRRRP